MSDQKYAEIVEEKLLSYTNAYVSNFLVVSSDNKIGTYSITARVTVALAPLLKTLQENNVPTIPVDSELNAATAETIGREKADALEIYKDLLSRLDNLVQIGIGKAKVSPSIPSAPGSAWMSVPITFFANQDAMREWRTKFELIADRRTEIMISTSSGVKTDECIVPMFDFKGPNTGFLNKLRPESSQIGVAACFMSGFAQNGWIADCFGRAFVFQTAASTQAGLEDLSSSHAHAWFD